MCEIRGQLGQERDKCWTLQSLCDRLVERFKKGPGKVETDLELIESVINFESKTEKENELLLCKVNELEADRLSLMRQFRKDRMMQIRPQEPAKVRMLFTSNVSFRMMSSLIGL